MMMSLDELRLRFTTLDTAELDRWIENRWILPEGKPDAYFFQEIDVARVRLVAELQALAISDEAMPLVLSLLDRVYAMRRQMRLLREAIDALPVEVRQSLWRDIRARTDVTTLTGPEAQP